MTTAAYFIKPDGTYFLQVSMGGTPLEYRQVATHPEIRKIDGLNPDATHLEFRRLIPTLYGATRPAERYGMPIYVFRRALRLNGPLIHERFEEVPLFLEPLPAAS